jgi:hypothetical protein
VGISWNLENRRKDAREVFLRRQGTDRQIAGPEISPAAGQAAAHLDGAVAAS